MTQNNSSISVVIPFYNRSHFIAEIITSITNQTYKPDEIIVIDDCSTIEENQRLHQITSQDDFSKIPIIIIKLPQNSGVSYARNVGVANASGKLIAFLDSDDYWDEQKLEKQVRYLNETPACHAVHTGTVVFNSDGEIARYTNKPVNLSIEEILKSSHVTPPSLLIEKNVFDQLNGFDPKIKFCEDYDFTIRLLIKGYQIHCINEPLTYIRRADHEKLTDNIWHYFIWHMYIVFKYKSLFIKHEGWFALNKYTAKYLYSSVKRMGGIANILSIFAFLIYPPLIFIR